MPSSYWGGRTFVTVFGNFPAVAENLSRPSLGRRTAAAQKVLRGTRSSAHERCQVAPALVFAFQTHFPVPIPMCGVMVSLMALVLKGEWLEVWGKLPWLQAQQPLPIHSAQGKRPAASTWSREWKCDRYSYLRDCTHVAKETLSERNMSCGCFGVEQLRSTQGSGVTGACGFSFLTEHFFFSVKTVAISF